MDARTYLDQFDGAWFVKPGASPGDRDPRCHWKRANKKAAKLKSVSYWVALIPRQRAGADDPWGQSTATAKSQGTESGTKSSRVQ